MKNVEMIKELSVKSENIRYKVEEFHRILMIKKETQSNLSFSCEKLVNFNPEFKNETQRKTALKDMLSISEEYQGILKEIQETELYILTQEHERNLIKIEIEYYKNLLAFELKA